MKFVVAFAVLVAVAVCEAAPDRSAIIVRDIRNNQVGGYKLDFATSNGIQREEVGEVKEFAENRPIVVRGTASWTTPEGSMVELKYYADETGYHPTT